ncbi:glycoside hydrolase family 2 TIM barrel-domain containing protein [Natronoarchaeum mannanilyticum]
MSGVALGTALPIGASAAQATEEYEAAKSSVELTPRPDQADVGGTRSLNGTWDFTLAGSETPPAADSASRVVTPDRTTLENDAMLHDDPPIITDPDERAVDLAGDGYVAVGDANSLDFTSPGFTVQLTFKYTEDTVLFSKGGNQYSAGVYGGELSFWTKGEGGWPSVGGGDLSPGDWYRATFAVDDDEIRIYVEGERVGTASHGFSSLPSTDSPLHLGYNSGTDTQGTPAVDSLCVFDTVLTDSDVSAGFDSIPDSAVAWLPFDESESGTSQDESSAGNDASLVNDPPFVSGRDGRGLDLAGPGYVTVAPDDSLNFASTGFALQAMVRYDGGSGLVLDKGSSGVSGGTEQFGLGIYDGTVSFYMQSADGSYPQSVQTDISTGGWHRITVVVDDAENRLYVDGDRRGAVSHDADGLASSDAAFVVGGDDLDVAVKSTAAFDAALSDGEVASGFTGVPDSAVLWLPYNVVEDRSVEWRDESVPGQWAYDEYFVPDGASDWYPQEGQLGWYRREFEVPEGWDEGRLKLRFDGVYSRGRVFVNGTEVADHVGGYTPFEADITDVVDPEGSNTLAVGVAQRSKADDMGWQNVTGGITRDVTLLSIPDAHLADCDVRTTLDTGTASVAIDATVANVGETALESAVVEATLTDPDGEAVASKRAELSSVADGASRDVEFEIDVDDPQPWNPEQPRLYALDVELDAGGTTERVTEHVGIREIEVDGNELLLNGESVTLRGVNWEEIHLAEHGHAVPPDVTRRDAERLKEANVNFVRTAHHPTSEAFLDACDELGIVVEVEAPHMFIGRHRGEPYPELVVRQTLEMVERDKNRPSVCIWSIANESDWYDCFDAAARLAKEVDPTRPTIFNHDDYDAADPWHGDYDLRADHYPALRSDSTVSDHAGMDAPLLFDEYAHTYCYNDRELVTDPGLRDEWGRVFRTIWEQCRSTKSVAGAALWAGGDHLEQWGEYLWGAVDRNGRRRPEFWHLRKVYAPVQFTDVEWHGRRATVTVENRHEFVNLRERTIAWDDGKRSGERSVDLPPGETAELSFAVPGDKLELEVIHPDGHVNNEFVASPEVPGANRRSRAKERTKNRGRGRVDAESDSLSLQVDEDAGDVSIYGPDGTLLARNPEFAVTPTQQSTGRDYASAIDHRLSGRTVTDVRRDGDGTVTVDIEYDVAEGSITVESGESGLDVDYEFELLESVDAREAGITFPADAELTTLSWSRDGLWSTYPEDHVGRLEGTASAFPDGTRSENEGIEIQSGQPWKDDATVHGSNDFRSTKRNVRSAALTDESGTGVRVDSDADQHVRAQVRSDGVDLIVLERSISGTNADGWLDRQPLLDQDPTLKAGETVRGSVSLSAAVDGTAVEFGERAAPGRRAGRDRDSDR